MRDEELGRGAKGWDGSGNGFMKPGGTYTTSLRIL